MKNLIFVILFCMTSSLAYAEPLPKAPIDANHPGSLVYAHSLFHETIAIRGRSVEFYAPADFKTSGVKIPVIIFGHGQAIDVTGYQETLEHIARKGVAVIFPTYDTGFFDRDWRRMANDFVSLSHDVLTKYSAFLNLDQVVFTGHSKGAYVALVAAGLPNSKQTGKQIVKPASIVLFAPAGFDTDYIKNIDPLTAVTLVWSDKDSIVSESLVNQIYEQLPSQKKQFITASSYKGTTPELNANHFFPLSKSFFFGGNDGISPFHFQGVWKWLLGATQDLQSGKKTDNIYLYGNEALDTGISSIKHKVKKSWSLRAANAKQSQELQTVDYVDVSKYLGTWYQIARNPLFFEGNCACSRQVLSTTSDSKIQVYNSCNDVTVTGPLREISGFATNEDPMSNSKFKVDFGLPKKGDYWIIGLGTNYEYAVVSDPSRRSLYILSKTPTLDPILFNEALAKASSQLDTSKLIMTIQQQCQYPVVN